MGSPGYGRFVVEKLEGIANVFAPNENCRFAQYTLRQISEWARELDCESIDVVHWNNGLWDVIRLQGDEPLTPLDMYTAMLKRIYKKIRFFFPNARVFFAYTTPVIENEAPEGCIRFNAEIKEYNEAAKKSLEGFGVAINDLYGVMEPLDESYYADWVHPNEKGARILADAVISSIYAK